MPEETGRDARTSLVASRPVASFANDGYTGAWIDAPL